MLLKPVTMLPHLAKGLSRNNDDCEPLKKAVSLDYVDTGALKSEGIFLAENRSKLLLKGKRERERLSLQD